MDSRGKSSSSIMLAIAFTLLQLLPGSVDSYPIFGTKRFQQHNSPHHLQQQQQQQEPQYVAPPVQIFAPLQSYGDENGYYADDPSNYLYYAPHDPRYHSYGVPSYRGDYKPTQYLYAQGPTYRYYEDNEAATNPLDDLHEEMLEEDERDREEKLHQREQQMRHQYGQQKHYQQQQLITDDYPDQLRKQQPKQQKHHPQSFYYQPVYEQPQQQQPEFDYGDEQEVDGANNNNNEQQMMLMMDPSYAKQAQANAAFLNDLIAYNRQMSTERGTNDRKSARGSASHRNVNPPKDYNTNWNLDYPAAAAMPGEEEEEEEEQWNQEAFDYDGSPIYPMETLSTSLGRHKSDDKAVRELQALTHNRDKSSSSSSSSPPLTPSGLRKVEPKSDDYWSGGVSTSDLDRDNEFNNNYEYEDGGDDWINWDSKRSGGVVKPISITAFSDRKPSKLVITKVPENHFVLDGEVTTSATTTGNDKSDAYATAPAAASAMTTKSGQKEEVLMRPAPPVRHPFSAPVMKMLEQQENLKTNKYESHAAVEDLENKKRSSGSEQRKAPKATVYDTIKQLLDMEEHLQQQKHSGVAPSRIQKRFVTNEGSLVKQLESLKRMKV